MGLAPTPWSLDRWCSISIGVLLWLGPNSISKLCKGFKSKRNIIEIIIRVVIPNTLLSVRCIFGGVVRRIIGIITITVVTTTTSWHWSVRVFVTVEVVIIQEDSKTRSIQRLISGQRS